MRIVTGFRHAALDASRVARASVAPDERMLAST
jgi:hypothetical protein